MPQTTGKVTILLDRLTRVVYEEFPAGPDVVGIRPSDGDAAARLGETEVMVTALTPVDRALIEAAPNLRFVQAFGVGVNRHDVATLFERGVQIANTPGQ